MRKSNFLNVTSIALVISIAFIFSNCDNSEKKPKVDNLAADAGQLMDTKDDVKRGAYLVTVGGCDDCHSPKIMTDHGPEIDSTRRLSGHPQNDPVPTYDIESIRPGKFFLASQDLTAWVGPWGVSFPYNLTPDKETGTGSWNADLFIRILRSGKHMGGEAARPILPPMPWQNFAQMTDEDLRAVFAFLQTLPPIKNKVPDPIPPSTM